MLIVSTSGPLGKFISMPPPLAIWYRALIAFVALFVFVLFRKGRFRFHEKADIGRLILVSVLMAIHLVTYFFALQYSNVAIGMLSLFTYPVITTLLEPLFTNSKIDGIHILFGIVLLFGIYLLVPNFDLGDEMTLGVALGIFSALTYAIRNILLKKPAEHYGGIELMMVQTFIISLLLVPVACTYSHSDLSTDWAALICLGILTTAIGHSLFISTFKHFTISKISILSSMQPVFGITLAFIFLQEHPSFKTILGGFLIVTLVIVEGFRKEKS